MSNQATETLFSILNTSYSLIFLYSPAYNLAFTTLVYSKHHAVTLYYSLTQRTGSKQLTWSNFSPSIFEPGESPSTSGGPAVRHSSISSWILLGSMSQVRPSTLLIRLVALIKLVGPDRLEMVYRVSPPAGMQADRC